MGSEEVKQEDIDFLDSYGWVVECESPLEISLEEDPQSRATGSAADIILDYLKWSDAKRNIGNEELN